MNVTKEYSESEFEKIIPIEKMCALYPKIGEQIMPLSVTGVSPRVFFNWKNKGIIDYPDNIHVKLDLFQYLWLRVCVALRNFGVPLKMIEVMKIEMFKDMVFEILERKEELLKLMKQRESEDPELVTISKIILPLLEKEYNNYAEEMRPYTSALGVVIAGVLLFNREAIIILTNDGDEIEYALISYKSLGEYSERIAKFAKKPHLIIPMSEIIASFLKNTENEKYIEKFELLSKDEKKVLDIIRNKDFFELKIKRINNENELKITKSKEKDIKGSQVNEIVRIFGLNQYEEVTMHLRSKEHIHFKCKSTCK